MQLKTFVLLSLTIATCAVAIEQRQFGAADIFKRLHGEPPLPPGGDNVIAASINEKWITQPLDHFDLRNNRTWQMVQILI